MYVFPSEQEDEKNVNVSHISSNRKSIFKKLNILKF